MFSIPARIAAAIEVNLEAQRISIALINKTFENFEKFVELQMTAGKAAFAESTVAVNELLSVKGPQDLFSLRTEERRHSIEKTFAYNRRAADIFTSVCAELNAAAKTQLAEVSREFSDLAESIAGNVPAGPEHAVALVKSSIAIANAGYRQLTKTTGQAVELLEGQMIATANHQFSHVVERAAGVAGKL